MRGGRCRSRKTSCFIGRRVGQLLSGSPVVSAVVLKYARCPLLLSGVERFAPRPVHVVSRKRCITQDLQSCLGHRPRVSTHYSGKKGYHFLAARDRGGFRRSTSVFLNQRSVGMGDVTLRWLSSNLPIVCAVRGTWFVGVYVRVGWEE